MRDGIMICDVSQVGYTSNIFTQRIEMNISSAIIYTNKVDEVIGEIEQIAGCEVHLSDEQRGIVIIVIEAESVGEEMEILERVSAIDGVIEANMHYSYSEEELERAREEISTQISPILDDSTSIEEVRYSGSVYNQMNKESK